MNSAMLTDEDIAVMFPERAKRPKAPPATEPMLRVKTADEIVAEARGETPVPAGTATTAASTRSRTAGLVVADTVPSTPAREPPASAAFDSPELVELRAIHAELRSIGAMLAVAINKLPSRK